VSSIGTAYAQRQSPIRKVHSFSTLEHAAYSFDSYGEVVGATAYRRSRIRPYAAAPSNRLTCWDGSSHPAIRGESGTAGVFVVNPLAASSRLIAASAEEINQQHKAVTLSDWLRARRPTRIASQVPQQKAPHD